MLEFRFAHPWAFLLLVLPVLLLMLYWRRSRRSVPLMTYSDTRLLDDLRVSWRVRLRLLPDMLRWLAWILLVVALARPQSGEAREIIRGQGIDIVLALDISSSMAALDFQPDNRLSAAKSVISDFITGREFDRIGLVVFARNAFHQAPLTLDYEVLQTLLDEVRLVNEVVDVEGNPLLLDGTAVGLGIASGATMMRDSDARSKVIILLTDGENNVALDPLTAADAASALGMRVYTIGIGKTGEIPVPDQDGNIVFVTSDLNEPSLQAIAERADGLYFRAEDIEGLRQIYAQIDTLERSPVERRVFVPWQDQAQGLIIAGFLALLAERFLRRTVFQSIP